jgi:Ca2+-binding EF-hand superfamily protein
MRFDKLAALAIAGFGLVAAHAMAEKAQDAPAAASKEKIALFDRLDANKDGFVSADEAKQMKGLNEAFASADRNGDARLDAAEFEAVGAK